MKEKFVLPIVVRVSCWYVQSSAKSLFPSVDRKWQDLSVLIGGPFVQNNQWSNSFSTDSDPCHHFLIKCSFLFAVGFLVPIHRAHPMIVIIAYSSNIKDFFVRKQDFQSAFFLKFVLTEFANLFLWNFQSVHQWKNCLLIRPKWQIISPYPTNACFLKYGVAQPPFEMTLVFKRVLILFNVFLVGMDLAKQWCC